MRKKNIYYNNINVIYKKEQVDMFVFIMYFGDVLKSIFVKKYDFWSIVLCIQYDLYTVATKDLFFFNLKFFMYSWFSSMFLS